MNSFSQEKEIDNILSKKKKNILKRERMSSIVKQKLRGFKFLVPLTLLVYLLFYSPVFVIKDIETNNLNYIDAQEIVAEFESLRGENFFLTDFSFLRSEVIQKHAFIERIYTEKVFPNRILINIREKEPVFVVNNIQGCYLLDKEGFVLLEGECSNLKSNYFVKEIFGQDLDNIEFTVNVKSNFYIAGKVCEIVNILDYYGYSVKSIEIEGQKADFVLYDGRSFVFSFADDIKMQQKRLVIVIKKIDNSSLPFKSIDLRYKRPVLKDE